MILGISPAIGNGLRHMKANGYLPRFLKQCTAYGERFDWVRFFSYASATDALELEACKFVPGGISVIAPERDGAGLWHGLTRPVRSSRYFKDLSVIRCISLLGAIPAIGARVLYGVPFVVSIGADYRAIAKMHGRRQDKKWRFLESIATRLAYAVVTPSTMFARELGERHKKARVIHLPNWVDIEHFNHVLWPYRAPGKTVLYVGRLVKEKNLFVLAEACAQAGAKLLCVGEGPLSDTLQSIGVEVQPAVPWLELPAWYAKADVFAMVSKTEGHCKALAEAMACGLPCVVSRAVREGMRPGYNCLQVDGDSTSVALAIEVLLADRGMAAMMGECARATASTAWNSKDLLPRENDLLADAAMGM